MLDASTLRRLTLALGFALVLAAAGLSVGAAQEAAEPLLKLTILHMNDPHGHYEPYPEEGSAGLVGGFAKAKTIIDQIRRKNEESGRETLVLMAGDLLMGTVFTETFKGELGATLLNSMGFTAMTVGNHEFDYGVGNLFKRLKPDLNCPLLSANIRDESFRPQFDMVKESAIGKTRLVLFGLTTRSSRAEGLFVSDPMCAAKDVLDRYRESDLIIALTHLGSVQDRNLLKACPLIDVIVGGHSHEKLTPSFDTHPRPIVQAGAYARYVGRLDLEVRDGKVEGYKSRLLDLDAEVKDDAEITRVVSEYRRRIPECWFASVGSSEVFLNGADHRGWSVYRTAPVAKLVTHVMAMHAGTQVAITNAGSIRGSLPKGDVNYADLFRVLPFPNRCVKMDLKGVDLQEILRSGVKSSRGYSELLQTFGLTLGKDEPGNLVIEKVRDEEFDPQKTYSVVTNDFLADRLHRQGLPNKDKTPSAKGTPLIRDLVADFIRRKGPISQRLLDELK
ncbi:MAG: bifunctional UDP-sugar hydrolase/5'-nucleotidase [Thermodesulfobacteriota bacterium]